MSTEFTFDLQQVIESEMVCADGVCYVPPAEDAAEVATDPTAPKDSLEVPPRD